MNLFNYVKNKTTSKVVICVPCRDTVHSLFAYNLIQLVNHCHLTGVKSHVMMETGSLISQQRQHLAEEALKLNPDFILWLDSDMMFPLNTIEILSRHNLPIVACNYSTRSDPLKGVAYKSIGDWDSWIDSGTEMGNTTVVEGTGMGCMLVKPDVFRAMEKPWFDIRYNDKLGDHIGEDFYFCTKAADCGYDIVIDNVLSREIRHLGVMPFDLSRVSR